MHRHTRGFTLVELLAAIGLMAIVFTPLLLMFSAGLQNMDAASAYQTAVALAVEELDRLELEGRNVSEMRAAGQQRRTVKDAQGKTWVVQRQYVPQTEPLEIRIQIFSREAEGDPEFDLVTYHVDS